MCRTVQTMAFSAEKVCISGTIKMYINCREKYNMCVSYFKIEKVENQNAKCCIVSIFGTVLKQ
mgnify:FL=1